MTNFNTHHFSENELHDSGAYRLPVATFSTHRRCKASLADLCTGQDLNRQLMIIHDVKLSVDAIWPVSTSTENKSGHG